MRTLLHKAHVDPFRILLGVGIFAFCGLAVVATISAPRVVPGLVLGAVVLAELGGMIVGALVLAGD